MGNFPRRDFNQVAGNSSESLADISRNRWPASNRNGGRHQIGIPGRLPSESAQEAPDAPVEAQNDDEAAKAAAEAIQHELGRLFKILGK